MKKLISYLTISLLATTTAKSVEIDKILEEKQPARFWCKIREEGVILNYKKIRTNALKCVDNSFKYGFTLKVNAEWNALDKFGLLHLHSLQGIATDRAEKEAALQAYKEARQARKDYQKTNNVKFDLQTSNVDDFLDVYHYHASRDAARGVMGYAQYLAYDLPVSFPDGQTYRLFNNLFAGMNSLLPEWDIEFKKRKRDVGLEHLRENYAAAKESVKSDKAAGRVAAIPEFNFQAFLEETSPAKMVALASKKVALFQCDNRCKGTFETDDYDLKEKKHTPPNTELGYHIETQLRDTLKYKLLKFYLRDFRIVHLQTFGTTPTPGPNDNTQAGNPYSGKYTAEDFQNSIKNFVRSYNDLIALKKVGKGFVLKTVPSAHSRYQAKVDTNEDGKKTFNIATASDEQVIKVWQAKVAKGILSHTYHYIDEVPAFINLDCLNSFLWWEQEYTATWPINFFRDFRESEKSVYDVMRELYVKVKEGKKGKHSLPPVSSIVNNNNLKTAATTLSREEKINAIRMAQAELKDATEKMEKAKAELAALDKKGQ